MGSTTVYMDKGRSSLELGNPAKTDLRAASRAMESEPGRKIHCFQFRRRYERTQPGQRSLIVVSARQLAPSLAPCGREKPHATPTVRSQHCGILPRSHFA